MSPIISYVRVSTRRQGASGLGLEAQRATVASFARAHGREIIAEHVEVESGKRCDRPELARALASCRKHGATLVVAKLDRLARDLTFIAGLMKDGVDFVACDTPYANRLTLQILAAVAEDEGRRISERVKGALAAAKARGTTLGGFKVRRLDGSVRDPREAAQKATAGLQRAARERAERALPAIARARAAGCATLAAIAEYLTMEGMTAPRGGPWTAVAVMRTLKAAEGGGTAVAA